MFKNIFSFSGRIRRREYWLKVPLFWLILIPITILIYVGALLLAPLASIITLSIVFLLFIWIMLILMALAAAVKRSHDLGNSGWFILIPIYNPFFLAFCESQPFKNKYGPNPKGINIKNNENLNTDNIEDIYKQLSLLHDLKEKGKITDEIYYIEKQNVLKKIEPPIVTQQTNIPPQTLNE